VFCASTAWRLASGRAQSSSGLFSGLRSSSMKGLKHWWS
jgi:hypothetical protein